MKGVPGATGEQYVFKVIVLGQQVSASLRALVTPDALQGVGKTLVVARCVRNKYKVPRQPNGEKGWLHVFCRG
jgi:hypothetical protein